MCVCVSVFLGIRYDFEIGWLCGKVINDDTLQFLGIDYVLETYHVLLSLSLTVIPKVHSYDSHFTD